MTVNQATDLAMQATSKIPLSLFPIDPAELFLHSSEVASMHMRGTARSLAQARLVHLLSIKGPCDDLIVLLAQFAIPMGPFVCGLVGPLCCTEVNSMRVGCWEVQFVSSLISCE